MFGRQDKGCRWVKIEYKVNIDRERAGERGTKSKNNIT